MKAVILAGGFGSRISDESQLKPKPLVKIGEKPILWHIMKIYSHYGINDFVICCGYKGQMIKEFFEKTKETWNISCIDTGLETMTGGRLKKIKNHINDTFHFTYGDTLSNVNILELMKIHKNKGKLATVTACQPPEKYGILEIEDHDVINFIEKPSKKEIWVNGGFFILEPGVFDYIKGDNTNWENDVMTKLVRENQLSALKHHGFYQPMDTIKEKNLLNELWNSNNAGWKVW
jgi:glucose-1-phosphate cytidylyltransferase